MPEASFILTSPLMILMRRKILMQVPASKSAGCTQPERIEFLLSRIFWSQLLRLNPVSRVRDLIEADLLNDRYSTARRRIKGEKKTPGTLRLPGFSKN